MLCDHINANILQFSDICLHKLIAKLDFLSFLFLLSFVYEHIEAREREEDKERQLKSECLYKNFELRLSYLQQNSIIIPNVVCSVVKKEWAKHQVYIWKVTQRRSIARQDIPLIFWFIEEVQGFFLTQCWECVWLKSVVHIMWLCLLVSLSNFSFHCLSLSFLQRWII